MLVNRLRNVSKYIINYLLEMYWYFWLDKCKFYKLVKYYSYNYQNNINSNLIKTLKNKNKIYNTKINNLLEYFHYIQLFLFLSKKKFINNLKEEHLYWLLIWLKPVLLYLLLNMSSIQDFLRKKYFKEFGNGKQKELVKLWHNKEVEELVEFLKAIAIDYIQVLYTASFHSTLNLKLIIFLYKVQYYS